MKTDTHLKIIEYLYENGASTPDELADNLGISPQALYRQLHKLQEQAAITKFGSAPKTYYQLTTALVEHIEK